MRCTLVCDLSCSTARLDVAANVGAITASAISGVPRLVSTHRQRHVKRLVAIVVFRQFDLTNNVNPQARELRHRVHPRGNFITWAARADRLWTPSFW